ncbi:MAG: hypothetical protein LBS74_11455 [Oscillospiraceae bacterium]|nr:hypothetical protein [Oscillospiraceae bacterium]
MKIKIKILAILAVLLLLGGCSAVGGEDGILLRPPRPASGDLDDIQRLLTQEAGSEITYKYPKKGDYRYAVIPYDLDSDGNKENVVFYQLKSKADGIRVAIFKKEGGKWHKAAETAGLFDDVDRIIFYDFDGNGVSEILIGWAGYLDNANILTAYRFVDGHLAEIPILPSDGETSYSTSLTYAELALCDIDKDKKGKELISVELNTVLGKAKARQWEMTDSGTGSYFKSIDSVNINGDFKSFKSSEMADYDNAKQALFLTAQKNDGMLCTKMIGHDSINGGLVSLLEGDYSSRFSARDIEGDGTIKIPYESLLPCYKSNDNSENPLYLTTWSRYDHAAQNSLSPIFMAVHNRIDGYYLKLNKEWVYIITAKYDPASKIMSFYKVNPTSGSSAQFGDELFRLRSCKPSQLKDVESQGYHKLAENNQRVYCASIGSEESSALNINYETLQENFKLMVNS